MNSSRKSESGSALLLVLVITPVLLLVLLSVSIVVTAEVRVAALDRDLKAARYVAEQGLEQGEQALLDSFAVRRWDDDLDSTGAIGRPAHADGGDQPPLSLADTSLTRNGLIVYHWDTANPGDITSALYRVPVAVRGGNARYTVWVRNNADDYGATVTTDSDNMIRLVALGEVLDAAGGIRARSFLTETLVLEAGVVRNYEQKGLGSGGANTIEN